jgi:hypothetical protein
MPSSRACRPCPASRTYVTRQTSSPRVVSGDDDDAARFCGSRCNNYEVLGVAGRCRGPKFEDVGRECKKGGPEARPAFRMERHAPSGSRRTTRRSVTDDEVEAYLRK